MFNSASDPLYLGSKFKQHLSESSVYPAVNNQNINTQHAINNETDFPLTNHSLDDSICFSHLLGVDDFHGSQLFSVQGLELFENHQHQDHQQNSQQHHDYNFQHQHIGAHYQQIPDMLSSPSVSPMSSIAPISAADLQMNDGGDGLDTTLQALSLDYKLMPPIGLGNTSTGDSFRSLLDDNPLQDHRYHHQHHHQQQQYQHQYNQNSISSLPPSPVPSPLIDNHSRNHAQSFQQHQNLAKIRKRAYTVGLPSTAPYSSHVNINMHSMHLPTIPELSNGYNRVDTHDSHFNSTIDMRSSEPVMPFGSIYAPFSDSPRSIILNNNSNDKISSFHPLNIDKSAARRRRSVGAYDTGASPNLSIGPNGENVYTCPFPDCNKTFSRFYNLKSHQRTHTGERPYECDYPGCNARFGRNHDLKRHKRVHTGDRPYKCEKCLKTFSRLDALNRHLKVAVDH